jgi:UDP-galactopyranose mutase
MKPLSTSGRRLLDQLSSRLWRRAGTDETPNVLGSPWDLVCFSHLRWDFVFQRPQHLMSRFARTRRVFFIEEPISANDGKPSLRVRRLDGGLHVVQPCLPDNLTPGRTHALQQQLLGQLYVDYAIHDTVAWYYTPMALAFTRHLHPRVIVYDCMDELSAFKDAPSSLIDHEVELLYRADVVFTGGQTLYEAKRGRHPNVHAFPSSIDVTHFEKARMLREQPDDQAGIPYPRIGFAGVIDERMDLELVRAIAQARPFWHLVMIGPVVKIDPASVPQLPNIHYLGQKSYDDLPAYMSGWTVAMLPFAQNEATRYISPTKTPEYLAAGRTVVSTGIRDIVRPYGENGLVKIADDAAGFVQAVEAELGSATADKRRQFQADMFLSKMSWDKTWQQMHSLIEDAVIRRLNRRRHRVAAPPGHERRRIAVRHNGHTIRFHERRLWELV